MTKRITSEDCEGNIEDIEDGRYNSHVVPVSAEDDPGYEEIDYGDCTEFTVPLGRYGSHVVPIGGGGGAAGAACPNGGLKAGTNIDGKDCLSLNLKQDGAIILVNGQLAIDTSKLKITTDQVYPSGTDTGIVIDGPDGESWDTQYDYNQWLYNELTNIDHSDYVTHTELMLDQQRQDMALIVDQRNQDAKWAKDQERQDLEYEAKFVEVEGDTMTGDLIVKADVHTNRVDTRIVDSGENSNLVLKHNGTTKVYVGGSEVTIVQPLQLNTEGTDDDHAVTKKYIDDTKDYLQQEIIELEEEIEAIAPSVERGKWTFTAVGTVGQPGQFTMYDAEFGSGQPTGLFKSAKSIWFNEIDSGGTPHAFADVDDGELLEIFIDGSPDYGLYEVVGKAHDETQGQTSFWVVDVNFVRTLEPTTAVGPGELCRFKVFMAPSGGDASSFLLKSGDTMTGKLQLDKAVGDNNSGAGFTVKGTIADSYSSTSNMVQNGNLLQVDHIARNPDEINYLGRIKNNKNITTKEYVDDKITAIPETDLTGYATEEYVDDKMAELLAKIEELEMTGGTMESYQLLMQNRTLGSSGAVGPQINVNDIMSCENDGDNWVGGKTHYLASEYRHIYVCLEDGCQLNSTGQMSVMVPNGSERYTREGNIATFNVTRVEVCPPDKSSGKNIYRAAIQLDAFKTSNNQVFCNWASGFLFVTFTGGSLTKTSH